MAKLPLLALALVVNCKVDQLEICWCPANLLKIGCLFSPTSPSTTVWDGVEYVMPPGSEQLRVVDDD